MNFIKNNIYIFLFIALIIEGPITAFVGGEYISQGKINLFLFAVLAVLGDVIGDISIYIFGRFFYDRKYIDKINPVKKAKDYVTEKKFLENLLTHYPFLFFLIVKITPYISTPSLFSTGMKKYPFGKYLLYSISITCIVKTIYISLGYLGGISLEKLKLLHEGWSVLVLFLIIGLVVFYLLKLFLKKFSKKLITWTKGKLKKFTYKD